MGSLFFLFARYMEQSHQMLEQRNDTLKSSSEHSQARLLQAEQDKVHFGSDLVSPDDPADITLVVVV